MSHAPTASELPDLRVVRASQLVLHEDADERRTARLQQRLSVEQVVKNPPIVAPLEDDRFVVLDGANRTSALAAIGVPDVVVQVVRYEDVSLSTWNHLVAGMGAADLVSAVASASGVSMAVADLDEARRALEARELAAYLVAPDGTVHALASARGTSHLASALRAIVGEYVGRSDIYRVQRDELEPLLAYYTEIAGLLVYPPFTPGDIRAHALRDAKLPTGITRHILDGRALRVNTELRFLWSDTPIAEKNRWLSEWARHKLQASEIRFYPESTFLFDE